MKYLLVVKFLCEIYRIYPRARIFLNDQLLEEFSISADHKTASIISKRHRLAANPIEENITHYWEKILTNSRIFEVELPSSVDNVSLRIEIKNDDNNYTNGFMSRCTYILLDQFLFIPLNQKLYEKLSQICIKNAKYLQWFYTTTQSIDDLLLHTRWQGNEICNNVEAHKLGGSGNFTCNLKKKYGFYIPEDVDPTFLARFTRRHIARYLYDKYNK